MLSAFLSVPLSLSLSPPFQLLPSTSASPRSYHHHLSSLRARVCVVVLRECMPTHQAAQREANQTGQPTVRILIKLSVTGEQRAHRGHAEEKKKEGEKVAREDIRLSRYVPPPAEHRTFAQSFHPSLPLRVPLSYNVLECRRRYFVLASLPNFTRLALFARYNRSRCLK